MAKKHTVSDFQVGTEIFYTGDMANASGFGVVTKIHPADIKWGYSESVDMRLEDGRDIRKIFVTMFNESIGRRFMLKSEHVAKREAQIAQMRADYDAMMARLVVAA